MRMWVAFAALAMGLLAAGPALAQARSFEVPMPVTLPPNLPPPALPMPSITAPPALPSPSALPPPVLPQPDTSQLTALYKQIADLYGAGKYQDAQPLAEDYVAKVDNLAGTDSLAYASAISLLSRVHQAQGHFGDAEPLLNRSILLFEHQRGHDSELATEIDALAQLSDAQGRFEEAEARFARALALNEKDPASFGRSLNNVAWVYGEEGRYAEAEPLAKQALEAIGKASGVGHSDYGCALDTLAKLEEGQGHVADAEAHYRQALTILEKTLGSDHVSVATSRENLGGLLKSRGKLNEAEQLLKLALAAKERIYGKEHPNLAKTLSQLGDLYRMQGNADLADRQFQRALAIEKDALVEVPVFFATDRAQEEESGKAVHFGSGRAETLTFGQAMVVVPKPQAGARSLRIPEQAGAEFAGVASSTIEPTISATEVTRLAIRTVSVATDKDRLMQAAALRLGTAADPGEALVFVHGYNVSFENGLRRAAQIAYDIKFNGATFLFSWPSRERLLDYLTDTDTVTIAADHLADFVRTIAGKTKVHKIHFVAHSMGNMVLLRALKQIGDDAALRPLIGEVIDAAPDIDAEVFAHTVRSLKDAGGNFTLYASHGDWALWLSGWLRGLARAGFIGDKALITPGVETIDVTSAGTGYFSLNHDVYASSPVLVADMQRIIEKREHPPDKRTRQFEPVTSKDGTYWLFRREEVAGVETSPGAAAFSVSSPPADAPATAVPLPVNGPGEPPTTEPTTAPEAKSTNTPEAIPPANPQAEITTPPVGTAQPPAQPLPPSSTGTVPDAAVSPAGPAKPAQVKKRAKRVDPEWNTHPLEQR